MTRQQVTRTRRWLLGERNIFIQQSFPSLSVGFSFQGTFHSGITEFDRGFLIHREFQTLGIVVSKKCGRTKQEAHIDD
jgi:hypothetical protein